MPNKSLAKDSKDLTILVTGGAGFIGSHTVVELLKNDFNVVILDDLSNSSPEAVERVSKICDLRPSDKRSITVNGFNLQIEEFARKEDNSATSDGVFSPALAFVEASILDREALDAVFSTYDIDAIIHFAGFKAVGESVEKPLEYYWNNIAGTLVLADVARQHDVKNIVFSSSATVYGEPDSVPMTESSPKHNATNPYGQTKSMLEQILSDLYIGDNEWNIAILR